MSKRVLSLLLAVAFYVGGIVHSSVANASGIVTGNPTWQNVPNLGEEYGYYWTDASGNTDFIVCDTSGDPTAVYAEKSTAETGYKTETQTVTSTTETMETVSPLIGISYLYPAANVGGSPVEWGYDPGAFGFESTPVLTPDSTEASYGVFEMQNTNPFPVSAEITGLVPKLQNDWSGAGATGDVNLDTETVPPGLWYLKVPLSTSSTVWDNGQTVTVTSPYDGQEEIFGPETFADTVNYVDYGGQQYPVLSGGSGAEYWSDYAVTDISPYLGYSLQGSGNLIHMVSGFTKEQSFVPIVDQYVGELQPQAVPATLGEPYWIGNLPTLDLVPTFTITKSWLVNGGPTVGFSGTITGVFTNPTPLVETVNGVSVPFVGMDQYEAWESQGFQGTVSQSSAVTVPPNSSVTVQIPVTGEGQSTPYDVSAFSWGWKGSYTASGDEYPGVDLQLTSPDGSLWGWYDVYESDLSGGEPFPGDFRVGTNGVWESIGSPIVNAGSTYTVWGTTYTVYPQPSTTLTLPYIDVKY